MGERPGRPLGLAGTGVAAAGFGVTGMAAATAPGVAFVAIAGVATVRAEAGGAAVVTVGAIAGVVTVATDGASLAGPACAGIPVDAVGAGEERTCSHMATPRMPTAITTTVIGTTKRPS
jgi:hypothetical protein